MKRSGNASILARLLRNRSGTLGLALITVYLLAALCGVFGILPYRPDAQHVKDRLQPSNAAYVMGTDEFGRDVFSRILRGATNSLEVAIFSVAIAGLLGT